MQEHDPQDIHQIGPSDELKLEIVRRGSGPPLLLLPGEEALERDAPFLDELAKSYEVIIPSPPGFGRSTRPDWITCPDDIAYMMLDVVDDARAEERSRHRLLVRRLDRRRDGDQGRRLHLEAGAGRSLRHQDRQADRARNRGRLAAQPRRGDGAASGTTPPKASATSSRCRKTRSRSWRATARASRASAGSPTCTIPSSSTGCTASRCRRLLIWGENDGIVTPQYGEAYRKLIPDARLAVIPRGRPPAAHRAAAGVSR